MRAAALLIIGIVLTGCASRPERLSSDRLVRFFDELTYGNTAAPEGASGMLTRWNQSHLVYAIEGPHGAADDQRIAAAMAQFQSLTGLSIDRGAVKDAQITINFVKGPMPTVHEELAACYTRAIYNASGLYLAQVSIGADAPGSLAACLDHELMHAFGFAHHSVIAPSVMSPFRSRDTLTPADEAALRALYDHRLQAGMSRAETDHVVTALFAERVVSPAEASTAVLASSMALDGPEWHTVRSADTALTFQIPGAVPGVGHYYWSSPPDGSLVAEVVIWAAAGVERPRATLRYVRLGWRRKFVRTLTPEESARIWGAIGEHLPRVGPEKVHVNALGAASYAIALTTEGPCLVFTEDLRDQGPYRLNSRIDGYYCTPLGAAIDPIAFLDGLGLRAPRYEVPEFQIPH